jgi:competence protein ComEC
LLSVLNILILNSQERMIKITLVYAFLFAVCIMVIVPGLTIKGKICCQNKTARQLFLSNILLIFLILLAVTFPIGCSSQSQVTTNEDINQAETLKQNQKNNTLKVHYIDVGQADCALIQYEEHAMLIDAGNNDDADLITEYIRAQGISKLEYIIGTHPHEDHIGSLDTVINSFDIGKVYLPKVTNNTRTFMDLVSALQNKGLKVSQPVPGSSFQLDEVSCIILAPNSNQYEELNNYSIVIKVIFGDNSFLFTGDAESISEQEMLANGYDLSADVLKVGHHGSSSSTTTEFLSQVQPKYAVISVGKNNDYGHPHRETIANLISSNTIVFRTDQCGTIIASSDGKTISFNKKSTYNAYSEHEEQEDIVYITAKGQKFHLKECSYLDGSQYPVSKKDAQAQGYESCKVCKP